jgi:hypothetical protein
MDNSTCPSCGHLVPSNNTAHIVLGGDASLGAMSRLMMKLAVAAIPALLIFFGVSLLLLLMHGALLRALWN